MHNARAKSQKLHKSYKLLKREKQINNSEVVIKEKMPLIPLKYIKMYSKSFETHNI